MKLSPNFGALMPERGFSRVTRPDGLYAAPFGMSAWRTHDGITAISSCADMNLPGGGIGPTWLITVTRNGQRPTDDDMRRVIECFDMPAFEEDNHYPGISRGLFCPHDPARRTDCECKLTETTIVDPQDGYRWTNPTDGPCRGCDLAAIHRIEGLPPKPCPIHGEEQTA